MATVAVAVRGVLVAVAQGPQATLLRQQREQQIQAAVVGAALVFQDPPLDLVRVVEVEWSL
jgi:hypothetical protein